MLVRAVALRQAPFAWAIRTLTFSLRGVTLGARTDGTELLITAIQGDAYEIRVLRRLPDRYGLAIARHLAK
jgi:hypothetical protein